jgi:hypothetical protein
MIVHPGTGQPLVNQWEVNVWMMEYLRNRYHHSLQSIGNNDLKVNA